MRIAVCVKQVPASMDGTTDMLRGHVVRTGSKRLNPFDAPAIEAALRLRDDAPSSAMVHAISMGPASARDALVEALAMGADDATLLCDAAFAGADSLATARTLRAGIQRQLPEVDCVLCGQQTTDGDTGQVGASLAALLDVPYFGYVLSIAPEDEGRVTIWQQLGEEQLSFSVELPAVFSIERTAFTARLPNLKNKIAASKKEVHTLGIADFPAIDPDQLGSAGSPTKVKKVFYPEKTERKSLARLSGSDAASAILSQMEEALG